MAIFGNGNGDLLRQIHGQLGRVGEDLAALKQQVADQQHAIDQARRDANTQIANGLTGNRDAINAGLSDNRAVIREGLEEINRRFGDSLTHIGSELGTIHDGINHLDGQLQEGAAPEADADVSVEPAQPELPAGQAAPPEEQSEPEPKPEILLAAAGIAHAAIQAHRDTWAFLVQVAGNTQHFHIPGKVKDDHGVVSVHLSGPSLVAALTSLNGVRRDTDNSGTRAIAGHIQGKITDAVQEIIDNPRTSGDGTPVRIVIDDRPQVEEDGDAAGGGRRNNKAVRR